PHRGAVVARKPARARADAPATPAPPSAAAATPAPPQAVLSGEPGPTPAAVPAPDRPEAAQPAAQHVTPAPPSSATRQGKLVRALQRLSGPSSPRVPEQPAAPSPRAAGSSAGLDRAPARTPDGGSPEVEHGALPAVGGPVTRAVAPMAGGGHALPVPATAEAVAARSIARPAAPVRLVRRAAAPARVPVAVAAGHGVDAGRLARATGGELEAPEDGRTAVAFPVPGPPVPAAPAPGGPVRAVAPSPGGPVPAPAPSPVIARQPAKPPAAPSAPVAEPAAPQLEPPAGGGDPPGRRGAAATSHDVDRLYEQVLDRLRRDLVVERERAGELVGTPGWGI
ncbi:MAG TPA: hypothetical protein VD931_14830, partial [Baekduia sp.]|nr:hypothetical protein [Baekduia sp.]